MLERQQLLEATAGLIFEVPYDRILRVAIDGVDGAGKTTFADELAAVLVARRQTVIRASVDGFHNCKAIRYQRGRASATGFYLDSYNYVGLKQELLDPLSPGGSGRYRTAIFDHRCDSPVLSQVEEASIGSILIFDGIFLHRTELRSYWDFSIFFEVEFTISIPRGAQRGPGFALPDPEAVENQRYVEGQKKYLAEYRPEQHATLVIDNNDLLTPRIVSFPSRPK
jgi:uridine kinase